MGDFFNMRKFIEVLIIFYQKGISPFFRPHCRYIPRCSDYMKEAVQEYGAIKGLLKGFHRILRCQPLGSSGFDPVKPTLIQDTHSHGE